MWRSKRPLGILLATTLALCPLGAGAQEAAPGRANAGGDRREEPVRIQVNVTLFFPGPTGESEEAVKLRERARRAVYEMAGSECALVEQVLAKTCRLETVTVNVNRQAGGQGGGPAEGYAAGGNFVLRTTLK